LVRFPIIEALFERGKFQDSSTGVVALALMYYAPGLIAHSGIEIITRAFYALHDTRTPVYIGVAAMVANLLFSLTLIGPMKVAGLALANSIAAFLEIGLLLWFIAPRVGGLGGARTWNSLGKVSVATAVMAAAVWAALGFVPAANAILRAGSAIMVGGAVFVAVSVLIGVDEMRMAKQIVLRITRSEAKRPAKQEAE